MRIFGTLSTGKPPRNASRGSLMRKLNFKLTRLDDSEILLPCTDDQHAWLWISMMSAVKLAGPRRGRHSKQRQAVSTHFTSSETILPESCASHFTWHTRSASIERPFCTLPDHHGLSPYCKAKRATCEIGLTATRSPIDRPSKHGVAHHKTEHRCSVLLSRCDACAAFARSRPAPPATCISAAAGTGQNGFNS